MIADSCWMWSMILDQRTRHDQLRGSHHQGWCQRRTLGFHPKLNKVFLFERNFTKRKLGESAGREPGPIFSPSCFSGDMWKWSNLHNIPQGCSGGFPLLSWPWKSEIHWIYSFCGGIQDCGEGHISCFYLFTFCPISMPFLVAHLGW